MVSDGLWTPGQTLPAKGGYAMKSPRKGRMPSCSGMET